MKTGVATLGPVTEQPLPKSWEATGAAFSQVQPTQEFKGPELSFHLCRGQDLKLGGRCGPVAMAVHRERERRGNPRRLCPQETALLCPHRQ